MASESSILRRRSLAEDEVDRYTNYWAVLLLALLALVAFVVPLSTGLMTSSKVGSSDIPRVKANCWCPAQFEQSQTDYTNEFCSEVANAILRGAHPIYSNTFMPHSALQSPAFDPKNSKPQYNGSQDKRNSFKEKKPKSKRQNAQQGLEELVTLRAPLLLALFAVSLRLPRLVWSLLNGSLTSCLNVNQVLQMCVDCRSLDLDNQNRIWQHAKQAVTEQLQQSRKSAASLYMLMKFLTLIILVIQTLHVSLVILPELRSIEVGMGETDAKDGRAEVQRNSAEKSHPSSSSSESTIPTIPTLNDTLAKVFGNINTGVGSGVQTDKVSNSQEVPAIYIFPNNIYHCYYEIRQLSNVHDYTVQCLITPVDNNVDGAAGVRDLSTQNVVQLYQALFTVILAVDGILLISSILNASSWCLRLTLASCATAIELPGNAATDLVFLVNMASLNAGPSVAKSLSGNDEHRPSKGDGEARLETEHMMEDVKA